MPQCKILFTGPEKAGKTWLAAKMVNHSNLSLREYAPTIGASLFTTRKGDHVYNLWDTAGAEKYNSLFSLYAKVANVVLFCFDLTDKKKFTTFNDYITNKITILRDNQTPVSDYLLVGTKADSENDKVTVDDITKLIDSVNEVHKINLKYVQTSAQTGEGVDYLFQQFEQVAKNKALNEAKPTRHASIEEEQTHSTLTPTLILGLFSAGSGALGVGLVIAAVATALILPIAWPIGLGVGAGIALLACGIFAERAYASAIQDKRPELGILAHDI